MVERRTIISFAILLLAVAFIATNFISPVQQSIIQEGITIQSISAPVQGTDWIVTTTLGGSERIEGIIFPQGFQEESGTQTEKSFTIRANAIEETLLYRIRSVLGAGEPRAYAYNVQLLEGGVATNPPACPLETTLFERLYGTGSFAKNRRICVARSQVGIFGTISQPSIQFQADITVGNGEEDITRRITSEDRTADFNGKVRATWTGSLITGDPAPSFPVRPYLIEGDRWQFTSETLFQEYTTIIQVKESEMRTIIETTNDGIAALDLIDIRVQELNNARFNSLDPTAGQELFQAEGATLTNPQSEDNSALRVSVNRQIAIATVRFDIDTDFIGVIETVGQPRILNAQCEEVRSGEDTTVTMDIENIGSENARFQIRKQGCPNFQQRFSAGTNQVFLSPGEIAKDVQYVLSTGTVNTQTAETCTLIVSDTADPSREARIDTLCRLQKAPVCTPNTIFAENNVLRECNDDGTATTLLKDCRDEALLLVDGEYLCESEQPGEGEEVELGSTGSSGRDAENPPSITEDCPTILGIPTFTCVQNALQLSIQIFSVIVGALVFVLIGLGGPVLQKDLTGDRVPKDTKKLYLGVGILLGIAVGYLGFVLAEFLTAIIVALIGLFVLIRLYGVFRK